MERTEKDLLCPVCGKYSFTEYGAYEICPVCFWEDDPLQRKYPWLRGGANNDSLNEAREHYEEKQSEE